MSRFSGFLSKQGHFLLENDRAAMRYIAILAIIPFAAWLSAAIIALITLRRGWREGFRVLAVAILSFTVLSLMSMPFTQALSAALLAFLPCYLTAGILHATASWRLVGFAIVLQALFVVMLIHWLAPELMMNQYRYILSVLQEMAKESPDSTVASLFNNQNALNQQIFASYFLGIQSVSISLSTVISVALARSVQSKMFYPGGFKQEMLGFRASGLGVILLFAASLSSYKHNSFAVSCLPILVVYFVTAGLSLSFNILAKGRGVGTFILLLIPLALLPFFMIPMYVAIGVLDSLFNIRLYLSSRGDGKEKKG